MRMTVKGQVTIPIEMREKLGLHPNSEVEFELLDDMVCIRKATSRGRKSRGQRMLELMRRAPKPSMTTDELMAMTRGED
jgi:AbrB family looped-hinge helix DNA binding protein